MVSVYCNLYLQAIGGIQNILIISLQMIISASSFQNNSNQKQLYS